MTREERLAEIANDEYRHDELLAGCVENWLNAKQANWLIDELEKAWERETAQQRSLRVAIEALEEYPCVCCKENWCFRSTGGCNCEVKTICARCEALQKMGEKE